MLIAANDGSEPQCRSAPFFNLAGAATGRIIDFALNVVRADVRPKADLLTYLAIGFCY